jgi:hypothetical protein
LQVSQEIEARATNVPTTDDFDLLNARRMRREYALYAHAVRNLANRERSANTATLSPDHNAFEHLDTFFIAFANLGVNAYAVPGTKLRKFCLEVRGFDALNDGILAHD